MSDQEIKILNDREHVLARPGMYVGSIRPENQEFWVINDNDKMEKIDIQYIPAQYKIFCEILDNSIDEIVRGYGNTINVTIDKVNEMITIEDNGRGIPLENHKEAKVPTPQVVFTQLRSGSNFDDSDRMTIGMNGVGASLATVFSEKLIVEIKRNNKIYTQSFTNNLKNIGEPNISRKKTIKSGTKVSFKPDKKIFEIGLDDRLIHKRCLELTYMFNKLTINLEIINSISDIKKYELKGDNFEDYIKLFSDDYVYIDEPKNKFKMAICCNNVSESFEQVSNVNGADTWRGGSHIDYMKELFGSDLKDKIKKEFKIEVSNIDVYKNMFVILFLNWNAPQFEGQTKEKLVNDKKEISEYFNTLFSSRKVTNISNQLKCIKQKTVDLVTLKNDKKLLSELKKKQKVLNRKRIPKLIECSSKTRSKCSIYITEGDSAISNLATVRDSKFMAGLPLRGKILNVNDTPIKSVIDNKEIQSIISSIGLKLGENAVESNSLNYGKIIIATDQDMDGYSIRCLLVNFFFKFWPELFEKGLVYILETPLYEVIDKKNKKNIYYFYDKKNYDEWSKNKQISKYEVSYFKGLGSCGKEAWDYMINENPNLVQIKCNNNNETKDILTMAFGNDTDLRKKWLS